MVPRSLKIKVFLRSPDHLMPADTLLAQANRRAGGPSGVVRTLSTQITADVAKSAGDARHGPEPALTYPRFQIAVDGGSLTAPQSVVRPRVSSQLNEARSRS